MFKRFRWRITATYIGLVILSMLVLGFFLVNSLENYFYNTLKTRLETQAVLASRLVGETQGVWNPAFMEDLAERISSDVGARVTIIDLDGTVLGDSEEKAAQMENHLNRPEVRKAMHVDVGTAIRHSSTLDTDMMYVAVTVAGNGEKYGFMRLALPLAETEKAFSRLWSVVLAAILLAVSCTVFVSLALAQRVTEPVERLTELARRISRGEFECRAEVWSNDEIGELARALNHMAVTVKEKVRLISEGKSRLEAVLANMTSGVLFINKKGRMDLVNLAAEQFLCITGKGSIGLPHDAVIKHPELSATISKALESEQLVEQEIKISCLQETSLDVIISPIRNEAGEFTGVVAVLHDITEMRRLERMRKEFVANVSHELKTPVTSIKGFTETLLDGAMDDRETCREFVEIIDSEADRLQRLIGDLLELSRIEAKKVALKCVPADVSSVIRNTVSNFQGQIEKAGLKLDFTLPEKPVMAEIDRDIVQQVLVNLVDNAIKYTPAGGQIEIEVMEKEHDIVIVVRDTGMGIPPEDINRVFERFYRVDKARSREKGGTGLGLSIVKHLVDIHGGTVGVNSAPGQGSEFFFTLPKNIRRD